MATGERPSERALAEALERARVGGRMVPPQLGSRHVPCAQCGRRFALGEEWAYRVTRRTLGRTQAKYFCSYGCMRRFGAADDGERRRQAKIARELAGEDE